jgi:hypothetical protein
MRILPGEGAAEEWEEEWGAILLPENIGASAVCEKRLGPLAQDANRILETGEKGIRSLS